MASNCPYFAVGFSLLVLYDPIKLPWRYPSCDWLPPPLLSQEWSMLLTVRKMAAALVPVPPGSNKLFRKSVFVYFRDSQKNFSSNSVSFRDSLWHSVSGLQQDCLWCWSPTWLHYGISCCSLRRHQPFNRVGLKKKPPSQSLKVQVYLVWPSGVRGETSLRAMERLF